ncbi:unnamed protein product [Toxocara canis]|uniref:DUF5880 domain-containing protein n=1 Tax=Toxocara canis TaxID=6265 RepID=A0A183TVU5_TOXCA|nr:unnamed protein product [Toxocara canis]
MGEEISVGIDSDVERATILAEVEEGAILPGIDSIDIYAEEKEMTVGIYIGVEELLMLVGIDTDVEDETVSVGLDTDVDEREGD